MAAGWDEHALEELAEKIGCEAIDVNSPARVVTLWVLLVVSCVGCTAGLAALLRCYTLRIRKQKLEEEDEPNLKRQYTRSANQSSDPRPDVELAKLHLKLSSPVDREDNWRPLWGTPIQELGVIGGPGLGLYFQMLMYLGFCFVVMFLFSMPLLVFSSLGDFAPPDAASLPQSMIANLGTPATAGIAQENRLVVIRCHAAPLSSMTEYFGWLDFLGVALFTSCAIWLRFFKVPRECKQLQRGSVFASEYTVEVNDLPRQIADHARYEQAFREHMHEQLREVRADYLDESDMPPIHVCEVVLVRDRGMELGMKKKRAQLRLQKEISDYKQDKDKSEELQKQIEEITNNLSTASFEDAELDVLRAYVTVNCAEDSNGLLSRYRFAQFGIFRAMQSRSMRFEGTAIRLKRAPEPSNILWDNQDAPSDLRLRRRIGVLLCCVVLVGMCLLLMYGITKQAVRLTHRFEEPALSSEGCASDSNAAAQTCKADDWEVSRDGEEWVLFNTVNGSRVEPQGQEEFDCFCSAQGIQAIYLSGTLRSACSDLLFAYNAKLAVSVFAAIIVVIVNVSMSQFLLWASGKELPLSISELNSKQMLKVFAAQTLNTACVLFAVHYSSYNDFQRGWYMVVGASICMTMAGNTVINSATYFLFWGYLLLQRRYAKMEKLHQFELLDLYTNPPFDMANRYAYLLMTVYVTMIYSSGLPVLNLLAALYCGISYWSDKMVLLWGSSRPPQFDIKMPRRTAQWLIFAGTLHCLVAIAMFGHPCVFPSNPLGGTLGELSEATVQAARNRTNIDGIIPYEQLAGTANTFFERLGRDSTWMFAAMFFSMLVAFVLYVVLAAAGRTLGRVLRFTFCPRKVAPVDALHIAWADAAEQIELERPPATYRMEEHPDLKKIAKYLYESVDVN